MLDLLITDLRELQFNNSTEHMVLDLQVTEGGTRPWAITQCHNINFVLLISEVS